jgi:hypothetical protein
MKDILLTADNDIYLNTDKRDIEITDSVRQAIKIRLLWFLNEWRFSPTFGMPYFEYIYVKNPDFELIKGFIRNAVKEVAEVIDCKEINFNLNAKTRKLSIKFIAVTSKETLKEELEIDVD